MPSCQCCARTHNPGTAKEVLLSLQWSPLFWGGHFFYFRLCNRTPKKGVAIFFTLVPAMAAPKKGVAIFLV